MNKLKELINQIPKATSYAFSMMMFTFVIIGLIVGAESIPIGTIIQVLVISIISSTLQMIAFTEIFIKRLAYSKRLALFMFPFLAVLTTFAIKYEWFPIANIRSWIIFIGIFFTCFIVTTILFEIYFKKTGNKYTGILNEYKNKNK